jgi:hypothetical protein
MGFHQQTVTLRLPAKQNKLYILCHALAGWREFGRLQILPLKKVVSVKQCSQNQSKTSPNCHNVQYHKTAEVDALQHARYRGTRIPPLTKFKSNQNATFSITMCFNVPQTCKGKNILEKYNRRGHRTTGGRYTCTWLPNQSRNISIPWTHGFLTLCCEASLFRDSPMQL